MICHLRYRSPIADTKGVDDVWIEIESQDFKEDRARAVAEDWLSRERPHPSTRLIFVRPAVVHSEHRMVALRKAEEGGKRAQATVSQPA